MARHGQDYQPSDAQLTLIFDTPLPAGQYSLIVPSVGGLTDLAGEPVDAAGQPAGVLANWTVSTAAGTASPDDLGVLWPSTAGVVWPTANGSFSETTTLAPGQAVTYRWVVIVPGYYKLQNQVTGSQIEIANSGNGKSTVLATGSSGDLNSYLMFLSDGVYELRVINVGSNLAAGHWLLTIESLDWEKIIGNGVSQASALSLMTFSPTLALPDASTISGLLSIAPLASGDLSGATLGPLPASLFVSPNTSLVGQPSWDGLAVGPAGPPIDAAGLVIGQAVANGTQLPLSSEPGPFDDESVAFFQHPADWTVPHGIPSKTVQARLGPDAASMRADVQALEREAWLRRVGSLVAQWFASSQPASPLNLSPDKPIAQGRVAVDQVSRIAGGHDGSRRNRRLNSRWRGDFAAAASVLMVGAFAYQLKRPLKNWWCQRGLLTATRRFSPPRTLPGPHPIAKASQITTRVRRFYSPR